MNEGILFGEACPWCQKVFHMKHPWDQENFDTFAKHLYDLHRRIQFTFFRNISEAHIGMLKLAVSRALPQDWPESPG